MLLMRWLVRIKAHIKRILMQAYAKHNLRGAQLGNNVRAQTKLKVINPKYMKIGNDCYFGPDCR